MSETEKTLRRMLKDICSHCRNREELLNMYIEQRLDASLKTYNEEMIRNYNIVIHSSVRKAMKKILKMESATK